MFFFQLLNRSHITIFLSVKGDEMLVILWECFLYITSDACEQHVAVCVHTHPFIKTYSRFFLSFR